MFVAVAVAPEGLMLQLYDAIPDPPSVVVAGLWVNELFSKRLEPASTVGAVVSQMKSKASDAVFPALSVTVNVAVYVLSLETEVI